MPDAAAPTSGTGIAPWTELGAAQVCLGEQTLGPPTSAVGGFCTDADANGAACTDDSACDSRQTCVCGRCTVAYCATASDCAAPRVCNFTEHRCDVPCSDATQCATSEQCISGACRGRCLRNADCQHGEVCDSNNVCIADDCVDDTGCLTGERCEIQRIPRQVLEPGPIADFGAPIVVYLDLAVPATPTQRAIYRATSTDGVHFALDPMTPVLDDPMGARAPSPIVDGGTLYLYFEQGDGVALRVATSRDGIAFDPPTTVLSGTVRLHAPSAVHVAGKVALYYQRADGTGIGLATGAPGSTLDDQGVVLAPTDVEVGSGDPGTAFWLQITRVESPHAVLAGTAMHLFFSAFGQESADASKYGMTEPIPPNFSVGYAGAKATAPQMLTVWPYGPVFDNVDAFLDHRDELGPAVLDAGADRFFMYYIDATEAQLGRLGVLGSGARGR
ncbi:MAG TPA: hypothetical protein VFV99_19170 [Kofleriaceae bacterium]|nr:hypothetical protein [Kofleriaceae bacterium]